LVFIRIIPGGFDEKGKYNVAVVGATGAVGNEMVAILQEKLPGGQTETPCLKRCWHKNGVQGNLIP
jgi:hypothetical protein